MSERGFFSDVRLQRFASSLFQHITAFVETGAEEGDTTRWAAERYSPCYTCEIDAALVAKLSRTLPAIVHIFEQNSPVFLRDIRPPAGALPLVFLDAHWQKCWPLLDELRVLSSDYRSAIIIIHDCAVPNRPNFWACQGGGGGNDGPVCDWAYIRGGLDFTRHTYRLFYPAYQESTPGYCVLFQDCEPTGDLADLEEAGIESIRLQR